MEYNIISATSPKELIEEVNKAIKEGWKPIGGICVVPAQDPLPGIPGYTFNLQSVVRKTIAGEFKAGAY